MVRSRRSINNVQANGLVAGNIMFNKFALLMMKTEDHQAHCLLVRLFSTVHVIMSYNRSTTLNVQTSLVHCLNCAVPYHIVWRFGAVGSDVGQINEVTLRWTRLVLGWVTVWGFNSSCGKFISV